MIHLLLLLADPLSLEQAVQLARSRSPELTATRAAQVTSALETRYAAPLPRPEFRWTSNNLGTDPENDGFRTVLALRWTPPRPGELAAKTRLAQARETQTAAGHQLTDAQLAAQVRHAYRRAVIAREKQAWAASAIDLRSQLLDVTRRQVAAGLKDRAEADLAELAVADARLAARQAESASRQELAALARLLGEDPATLQLSTPLLELHGQSPIRDAAIRTALERRPELRELDGACAEAQARESLARTQRFPWISSVQLSRRAGGFLGTNLTDTTWGLQVGVELPLLYRDAATGAFKIAVSTCRQCEARREAARAAVRREVELVVDELTASFRDLDEVENLLTGPSARILARLEDSLSQGRADLADLLTARIRHHTLAERRFTHLLAHARLLHTLDLATTP